jgi:pimeloyl-ACP methyl ester carboxylesterase
MSSYSHETEPTRFVEADGIRFAYRRFGKTGELPLLFLQYFNANMDDWDRSVTNGFALDRDVILFDNAGIGSTAQMKQLRPHYAPWAILSFPYRKFLANSRQAEMKHFRSGDEGFLR